MEKLTTTMAEFLQGKASWSAIVKLMHMMNSSFKIILLMPISSLWCFLLVVSNRLPTDGSLCALLRAKINLIQITPLSMKSSNMVRQIREDRQSASQILKEGEMQKDGLMSVTWKEKKDICNNRLRWCKCTIKGASRSTKKWIMVPNGWSNLQEPSRQRFKCTHKIIHLKTRTMIKVLVNRLSKIKNHKFCNKIMIFKLGNKVGKLRQFVLVPNLFCTYLSFVCPIWTRSTRCTNLARMIHLAHEEDFPLFLAMVGINLRTTIIDSESAKVLFKKQILDLLSYLSIIMTFKTKIYGRRNHLIITTSKWVNLPE